MIDSTNRNDSDETLCAGPAVDLTTWRLALRHPHGPSKSVVRHVLLTLATWGSNDGTNMYPSIEMLATATGLHRETVRLALESAARDGWLRRRQVARVRKTGFRYDSAACLPRGWREANPRLRAWEKDPKYASERFRRNRIPTPTVPVPDGDSDERSVPGVSVECPRASNATSPSTTPTVPVQDCPIYPGIYPKTYSRISEAFPGDENAGGRVRRVSRAKPRGSAQDPVTHVERYFVRMKGVIDLPADPYGASDDAARCTGLTVAQVREAIGVLIRDGRLPPGPVSRDNERRDSGPEPHEEPSGR